MVCWLCKKDVPLWRFFNGVCDSCLKVLRKVKETDEVGSRLIIEYMDAICEQRKL